MYTGMMLIKMQRNGSLKAEVCHFVTYFSSGEQSTNGSYIDDLNISALKELLIQK